MAKKTQKVFLISEINGDILGVSLASSREAFEKKCKKAGFEIVKHECRGENEGGCENCECDQKRMIRIPKEKFSPAPPSVSTGKKIPEGSKIMNVMFGDQPIYILDTTLDIFENNGGFFIFFEEIKPITL